MVSAEPPMPKPKSVEGSDEVPAQKVKFRMIFSRGFSTKGTVEPFIMGCKQVKEDEEPEEFVASCDNSSYDDGHTSVSIKNIDAEGGYYVELITDQDDWFRIGADFHGINQTNKMLLNPQLLCDMQVSNAYVMIFTDNRQVGCIKPSSTDATEGQWDIGFFNPIQKKFIQTNVLMPSDSSPYKLTRKLFMKYYFKLFKYLNEQNAFYNFSLIFGFNEGAFKFDDYMISSNQFIDRLSQLDIQWISKNVMEEQHKEHAKTNSLQSYQEELHEFFKHLANCFSTIYGEVCLKKVTERLEPHLGGQAEKGAMGKSRYGK